MTTFMVIDHRKMLRPPPFVKRTPPLYLLIGFSNFEYTN
jgi:hypothetical protein